MRHTRTSSEASLATAVTVSNPIRARDNVHPSSRHFRQFACSPPHADLPCLLLPPAARPPLIFLAANASLLDAMPGRQRCKTARRHSLRCSQTTRGELLSSSSSNIPNLARACPKGMACLLLPGTARCIQTVLTNHQKGITIAQSHRDAAPLNPEKVPLQLAFKLPASTRCQGYKAEYFPTNLSVQQLT